jgi:hypothetical protein
MSNAATTLEEIFFGYAAKRQAEVKAANTRFVHYTSAEVAANLIRNPKIWLRRATTMNDFMEVEYGIKCLVDAYKGTAGTTFKGELDRLLPGFRPELEKWFDWRATGLRHDTYLASFSEHRDAEDALGRLSMWRAYGGSTGVALVFKSAAFLGTSDALRVYSSPVAYLRSEGFAKEFAAMGERMAVHADFLKSQAVETVKAQIYNMFRFAVLGTKHPGFHEELEWRIVHSPSYEPTDRLCKTIEIIRGVPQHVIKVPLKNYPSEGLVGAELPEILDRIIIGPTQHPTAIAEAFIDLLREAKVPEPERKVCVSDIPLR